MGGGDTDVEITLQSLSCASNVVAAYHSHPYH
jgi:hypothetical protein